jgi:hypothetical protein
MDMEANTAPGTAIWPWVIDDRAMSWNHLGIFLSAYGIYLSGYLDNYLSRYRDIPVSSMSSIRR